MTLRQEAYEKIAALPDNGIRLVIALADEILKQSAPQSAPDSDADEKRAAFLNIMEYGRQHPFPKDFDWEKAREEAMIEKYGRFD
ncbi:MAG: hypothetical protein IJQ81_11235 [Oscillibacter sp.]|nr:hypothetical protein [Oscillibacter sp.]